jgi:hypothetical protein
MYALGSHYPKPTRVNRAVLEALLSNICGYDQSVSLLLRAPRAIFSPRDKVQIRLSHRLELESQSSVHGQQSRVIYVTEAPYSKRKPGINFPAEDFGLTKQEPHTSA